MVAKTPEWGARLDSHASTTLSLSYSVQLTRVTTRTFLVTSGGNHGVW